MNIDIFNSKEKYGVILTNPAWKQTKGNKRKCRPNQGKALDYETLSVEEIKDIHATASRLGDDCHNIFMWTIDKYLHEAELMMKELGYELHARFVWDKENGVAPAFTVRFTHEYLLWFYKKGHMLKPDESMRGKFTTVLREASTKHSVKPECAYQMIEAMFPQARKLEMFSRSIRNGWDCWGNQTGLLNANDRYILSAVISADGEEDIEFTYTGTTFDEAKYNCDVERCIKTACERFNMNVDEVYVSMKIEHKDECMDCDEAYYSLKERSFIA